MTTKARPSSKPRFPGPLISDHHSMGKLISRPRVFSTRTKDIGLRTHASCDRGQLQFASQTKRIMIDQQQASTDYKCLD